MTSRERLQAVLDHKAPDRLCVDFGAGGQTGIGVCAVHRLRRAVLGASDYRVKVVEPYQMLGEMDEDLRQELGLDVVGVHPRGTMFGFPNEGWKPFEMHDGTPVLVPAQFHWTVDPEGAVLIYPQGDTSAPPTGRMPRHSYFFDAIPRRIPVDDARLNPEDNMEEFQVLGEADIAHYRNAVTEAYEQTSYGIYLTLPGAGFGDIACVPAPWAKYPKGIRDVEEWYVSTAIRRDYVHAVFERQCEIALKNIEMLAGALRDMVQVVYVSGTDFGTQRGPFCSPASYRELFKPYHKRVNERIHKLTGWKTFIHSCGGIYELIPDLIEAGFDVLNPVQCSAAGMDPARLKREFGDQVVFWGGGVDTQKTLPFGTPDDVYREVRGRIAILGEGGGFVFNSIHNIQSDVPVGNILAMFRAVNDAKGDKQ